MCLPIKCDDLDTDMVFCLYSVYLALSKSLTLDKGRISNLDPIAHGVNIKPTVSKGHE